MDRQALRAKLEGVVAFPITPFNADLSLDLDGLKRNLEPLLDHPFCAIVAAGGTGEMYSLNADEYAAVVKTTVEIVGGQTPVIAAAGFNYAIAPHMAQTAAALGVDGILAFPPYYPNAGFEALKAYYQAIGSATELGMLIYSRDWAVFTPDQVDAMADIEQLIAWKDGQADIRRYQMIMNQVGDKLRWIGGAGDDIVPAYYATGIRTYTSSISNVDPALSIQLHEWAANGDTAKLQAAMERFVIPLYNFRRRGKGYEVSVMKRMMDLLGLVGGPVRPPLQDVKECDQAELQRLTALIPQVSAS
jgi:5-dehydro-4-deoxyglucarate dehydratase